MHNVFQSSGASFLILAAFIPVVVGCGSDRPATYPVSGRVVFSNGQPVKTGTVELLSQEHKINATGTIRTDGTFELGTFSSNDGACEGTHSAIVMQMIISEGLHKHQQDHGLPVDPMFGAYSSSPLNVTVKAGEKNEVTLTVEPARKQ
jgi:hypothetical protein